MIIIKLQGGLGNQLFQYAMGKTIEKKYNKDIKYDISSYNTLGKFTPRSYLLNKFNTEVKIANDDEIRKIKGIFSYFIKKILNKLFLKKYHISYEPEFLEGVKDYEYLEGYWQSYKYIEPCINELRKEIVLKSETPEFENAKEEVLKSESVAVHVRRGDYLNGVGLETLDLSYYKNANDYVSKKLKNYKYFIFTDDPIWAKENLQFFGNENTVFVSDFDLKDYEELVLMSQCKNIIIANSTFSLWGAALNQNRDSVIICPRDWKNVFLKNDEDLCPSEWVRI